MASCSRDRCNLVNIMQAWQRVPPWTAGEYVFDHSWAHSCARLTSQRYYPKLQSCVPFTPATGARILLAPGPNVAAVRRALATTSENHHRRAVGELIADG